MPKAPTRNTEPTPKKHISWLVPLAIGMAVIVVVLYLPGISTLLGSFWTLAIYDLVVITAALFAAYLATRLWRIYEPGEMLSTIWGCMAFGLILWAAGELIWSYDQLLGGNSLPYPSLADIFWIIGYIPVILALGLRLYSLKIIPNKAWQIAILGLYLLIFGFLFWMIIVPIFTDPTTTKVFEKSINLLYPIGDFIVGFLAMALVMVLIGGTIFRSWGLIAIGFVCAAVSDLLYAWTVWEGTYLANPTDGMEPISFTINLLYVAFYLLVAIGLFRSAKSNNAI